MEQNEYRKAGLPMKSYLDMTAAERQAEYAAAGERYAALKAAGKSMDMSRGKPNTAQLDLAMPMLALDPASVVKTAKGTDARNYGELAGVEECRALFAEVLGVKTENVIVGGQSSLNLMYDAIAKALLLGVYGGSRPWGRQEKLKFLCPVPGYDRHFAICQEFGIEMVNVPLRPDGPDMAMVRELVESDPAVKGIWCVPKYSNPSGYTYSDDTVRAFAALKPAADDFRIFWDNAYLVHGFDDEDDRLLNIFDACRQTGSEDMVYEFASTSKITFAGGGIAVMAASEANVKFLLKQMGIQTIGYDKVNQLRHVKFFGDAAGVRAHMKKHAAIIGPKFACVLEHLDREIAPRHIASWHRPHGGYFVAYEGLPGTAARCVQLCKEAGLVLTGAGAPYPYGKDPEDKTIRIAPSYPDVADLADAMELFCVAARMAALEALGGQR